MAYLVWARKWRPSTFEEMVNQKHVTITLQNALKHNRLANAYLFSGPRGIGKTTAARILAKCVNCRQGITAVPCNKCSSCKEIAESRSLDVFEIDGASNRGIDEVRNLRENIRYAPTGGKFRIYIVDEVHMLTTEAFNALLKTLEEPPRHVLFIFATTEPHKVPATILSRCQRFDFRRISISEIIGHLRYMCQEEKIEIDDDSLMLIAKKADGSMRDAQSLLDQIVSFSGEKIKIEDVINILGIVDQELFFEISDVVAKKDVKAGLDLVEKIISSGYDINELLLGLSEHFRNLLMVRATNSTELIETSELHKRRYAEDANNFQEEELLRLIKIASDTEYAIKRSPNPRLRLEMAVLKMIKLDNTILLGDIISKIGELKKSFETGENAFKEVLPSKEKVKEKPPQKVVTLGDTHSETLGNKTVEETPLLEESEEAQSLKKQSSSLGELKERWAEVVEGVKKKRIALGSFLQEGEPTKIENGTLEITFGRDNGFHVSMMNKGKDVIRNAVRELLNLDVNVKCVMGDLKKSQENHEEEDSSTTTLEELIQKEPIVKKIVETFNGELLR